jgi:hypothetical protein
MSSRTKEVCFELICLLINDLSVRTIVIELLRNSADKTAESVPPELTYSQRPVIDLGV